MKPAPHFDFGGGWAEIQQPRFGYWITAGHGSGVYEGGWFRLTRKSARRKARRLIGQANREHRRYVEREQIGRRGDG